MIEKTNSLIVAEKLLTMVLNDERTLIVDGTIDTYQNCREQGYSINLYNDDGDMVSISFAEYRSSDHIIVYFGKHANQAISDEAYENKKFFKYNDYEGAKEYIVGTMLTYIKEHKGIKEWMNENQDIIQDEYSREY